LITLNSDVICCQEFVKDEKFIEEMGKYGYNVAFKPRTGGNHSEGCAIFWKYEKYIIV
jgi:mRNA deadenylase 3'-5' endonuclease subunit Ccr4